MQKLYYPKVYCFTRKDIGRIVLYRYKSVLYPFMIIFNAHQVKEDDDDLLYMNLMTHEVLTMHGLCRQDYDYVQIVEDTDEEV